MKKPFKSIILATVIAVFVSMCLPNSIGHTTAFAKESTKDMTIGGVAVTKLSKEEIEVALNAAVTEWLASPVVIEGAGVTATIDPSLFEFDIPSTIADFELMTDKSWYAFWEQDKIVQMPLKVNVKDEVKVLLKKTGMWEVDPTFTTLLDNASNLKGHEIQAVAADTSAIETERLALSIDNVPANAQGVLELANVLNDKIIVPETTFSFLETIGDTSDIANQEALNFVASMMYHAALQSEVEILERHSQNSTPGYLQQGLDVTVNQVLMKDLQFVNRAQQPYKVKALLEGDSLKIELFAQTKDKDISVRVAKDKIVKPRIIIRYSDELAIGKEQVLQEGREGVRVEVYRSILENGSTTEELVSRDYYPPVNKIIVRSSREPAVTVGSGQPPANDSDLQIDLNGDGLPDTSKPPTNNGNNPNTGGSTNIGTPPEATDPDIVYGYYDKGGNFVQTSP
ncbi:MAG: VanW family protein [Lysinibacillus sp.]